jgi:hypothetical protein
MGPTAALPSPRREKGVRPEPLKAMSRRWPVAVDDFPDQQRPAVPQLGVELPELVPGVGLGDGLGPLGQGVPRKEVGQRRVILALQAQPQFLRQAPVEEQQHRLSHGRGLPGLVETGQVAGIGVVEGEGNGRHWLGHI